MEVQGACLGKDGADQCERMGGTCTVYTDGYYVEVAVCCVIGNIYRYFSAYKALISTPTVIFI